MVDIGGGLPALMVATGSVMVRPWLQLGLGYGYTPFSTSYKPNVDVQRVTMKLADGNEYYLKGEPDTTFDMLHPYIRIFPTENNFYVQLSYTMFRAKTTFAANLMQDDTTAFPDALTMKVTFTQPMPTLSIGRMFIGKIYVINFSLGASFVMNGSADVRVDSRLPISVGADTLNEGALAQAKADVNDAAKRVSEELRKQFLFLPSIHFSIGFVL